MPPPALSRRHALGLVAAPALLRASAAGAQTKVLKVGVLRLASSGPVFLAQDLGHFKDAGLAVELVFFDAAQPVAVAAAAGSIDIGVTGLTAGLYNLAGKGTVALIAGQSRETKGFPLEAYLATTRAPGAALKTLADIRGRTLGITQIGSSFHYAAGLIADKFGFPIQDVKFLPLQSMGNIGTALQGGRVDAAILPATSAQSLIDGGGARLIGWGSDEVSWQVGGTFVSRRTSATPDTLAAFLAAYRKGCAAHHDTLDAAVADNVVRLDEKTKPLIEIIAKHCGQPIERITRGLPYVDRDGRLDTKDVARQIAWYQARGFTDVGVELDDVLDKNVLKD